MIGVNVGRGVLICADELAETAAVLAQTIIKIPTQTPTMIQTTVLFRIVLSPLRSTLSTSLRNGYRPHDVVGLVHFENRTVGWIAPRVDHGP